MHIIIFSNSALRFMKLWGLIITVATTSYGVSFIYALDQGKEEVWLMNFIYDVFDLGNMQSIIFHKVFLIEYEMFLIWQGI